ncbi:sensor histidine kinase, partial [Massilia sp. ST3]|nr:sensor histidine kinase [Massilia sp. ST3]
MQARSTTQHYFSSILSWLYRAFDAVATWVTQLSWWKFFLFAILTLTAGAILQEELFNGPAEEEIARAERDAARRSDASILIDESGIHFNPRKNR